MLQRKIFAGIGLALLLGSSPVYAAPFPSLANDVGVCDPNNPSHCIAPDASGNVPITGTITASLGGFTPSASGARGTPLSVTTADSSGTLPTGAVTIVSNAGTTNPMYCNVNGVAATTSDQLIGANSWFAFTIPAAITTLHCIATGGTTTANMLGGAGLATGAGGGSGGSGGGGAITAALGSYAAGALSAGAFATGAGVDGWDLTQGAKADVAWASGSGSVIALLKAIATAEIATNRAVNVAQINGVAPLMGNGVTGTGSPRVTIASDNTPFAVTTNPTTAANWGIGTSTQNSATVANGQLALGQFNTAPTTITTGNMSPLQMDNAGNLLVNIKTGASSGAVAQGSTTSGQTGLLIQGAVTTAAPSYTTAQTSPLSLDTVGNLRVNVTNTNANGRAVSGSSSPVVPTPALTTWHLIAANSTNATSVKGSAATLFSCQLGGIAGPAFLKIYNKATAPTVGTDTPVKTLIIPVASTAANGAGSNISFGPGGLTLATGFAAAVTGVITDADATAVAAASFAINCDYE